MSEIKGTVLIMDDETMVCEIAEQILEFLGYEAQITSNGEEAIALYQEMLEKDQPLDVVIIDLNIPGGVGGKEAIKSILEIDPNAKVVVSSGYLNDPIMVDCATYGFSGSLAKPFEISSVETLLAGLVK